MRIETFVKKAHGKIAADVFLKENREFLCTFPRIVPILAMMEEKTILPTPALHQILQLIVLEKDPTSKMEVVNPETGEISEKTVAAFQKAAKKKEPKKYQLFLFRKDASGGEYADENDIEDAGEYGEAQRIANRILFRNEDSLYVDIIGMGITTRIYRDQAMGELLGKGPRSGPAMKKTSKSTASLGWKVSAKQYNPKFSRG